MEITLFVIDFNVMINKVRFITILMILGLFFSVGCHTSKGIAEIELFTNDIKEDKICFLVMEIYRESTDKHSLIKLKETTLATGKTKKSSILLDNPNKLIFSVIGDTSVLSTQYLDHPLFKKMEHSHEQNGLSTQTVTLTKEEFFMRIPLNAESRYITISESIHASEPIELITLKI